MRNRPLLRMTLVAVAFAALAAPVTIATSASAHTMDDGNPTRAARNGPSAVLDLIRAAIATAPYHSLDLANRAGYTTKVADTAGITCIAEPGQGAMGVHFLSGVDNTVEANKPELLVYEPDSAGRFNLVALEYLVDQKTWDATHSDVPSLFGQDFMLTGAGNRFGLDPFYSLHAWIWKINPSGLFSMWNPLVHCP